jgi:hypothetical protein
VQAVEAGACGGLVGGVSVLVSMSVWVSVSVYVGGVSMLVGGVSVLVWMSVSVLVWMIVWVLVGGFELWSGDNTFVEFVVSFVVAFVVAFVVVDISCRAQRTFFNSCGGGGFIERACG